MQLNKTNKLLAIAEPLLRQASEYTHEDYEVAHKHLSEFPAACQQHHYTDTDIEDARFFLCTFLDYLAPWKKSLVSAFFEKDQQANDFYHRLTLRQENSERHIDLLELAYICLALGLDSRNDNIVTVRDKLYDNIRDVRDTPALEEIPQQSETGTSYWRCPPVWLTVIIAIVLLFSIFIPYRNKLKQYAAPILQTLQHISQLDDSAHDH